jgi:MFS family permease
VPVNLFAGGMGVNCMPPLYGEIAQEIPMTHTQWGALWGISFLPMMIFSLLGGMYADRVGTRWIVGFATIAMGVFCIGRAFAQEFNHLLFTTFFLGVGFSLLIPNLSKSLAHWFPSNELGLANGFLTVGICIGSGSALLISGIYLSPLMWAYGIICITFVPLLSDKLGLRKIFIWPCSLCAALGLLLTVGTLGSFLAPLIGGILIDSTGSAITAFFSRGC